jgi:hypothetical protein
MVPEFYPRLHLMLCPETNFIKLAPSMDDQATGGVAICALVSDKLSKYSSPFSKTLLQKLAKGAAAIASRTRLPCSLD